MPLALSVDAHALRLVSIGRFSAPLSVTAPPGDTRRVFVVEQAGVIRVVRGGKTLGTPAPGAVFPVITHTHAAGWCSVTGGYVVRDHALGALVGRYVYGDYCRGEIYSARLSPGHVSADHALSLPRVSNLTSFGQDARGRIYVTSQDGPVYRLAR
jgi:hypothetical protein